MTPDRRRKEPTIALALGCVALLALLLVLTFLCGCVSVGYMERRVQAEKQDVEDRLTECQLNWQAEMRKNDARDEEIRERAEEPRGRTP